MKIVVTSFIIAVAAELFRLVATRRGSETPQARLAKMATWLMRPIAAVCAVNLTLRLSGTIYHGMNLATYPFYANEWKPESESAMDAIRTAMSSDGILPWLPVSLALCSLGVFAAFCVARLRPPPEGRGDDARMRPACSARRVAALIVAPVLTAALAFSTMVSVCSLPNGMFTGEGQRSSLLRPWHDAGTTMLYAIPAMFPKVKHYWRHFHKFQHGLTIHARSHPPVASSFVRWIGKCFGVKVTDPMSYRDAHARLRYALGQSFFSSLNVILVFAIGLAMFNYRTGLFAALLYAVAPSFVSYGTFAPDMNYALFFHGAILFTWLVATESRPGRALLFCLPLGLCYSMLNVMTFSWCIMTTISAAFITLASLKLHRSWREIALRVIPPMLLMVLFTGSFLLYYHIYYLAIYKNSSEYVYGFYHKDSFLLKALALVGGQVEWLSLLGPLTCSGMFLFLFRPLLARGDNNYGMQRLYLIVLLEVFLIPVLLGPACLKHEVARCWIWMAAVPVVCSASHWLEKASPRACASVFASSALAAVALRLFVRII